MAGKKYEYRQTKVFGLIPLKPKAVAIPSQLENTQETIQKPAKWLLWIALPISLLSAVGAVVSVVYFQNQRLAKTCGLIGLSLFGVSLLCIAWLIATAYIWIFIPIVLLAVAGIVVFLYNLTKGKGIKELLNIQQSEQ